MDSDSLQANITHESAALRAQYPYITDCHTALLKWSERGELRYTLHLDIRWPQHQTIISGAAKDNPAAAIAAAFEAARRSIRP